MTTSTEVAATMNDLEEIRKFTSDPDFCEQKKRLREFVDLCERLEKLKETGFLDAVTDTILKLV